MQISDFDIQYAMGVFKNLKRYVRKADLKLFLRCKYLNKYDIDFIEQISLIHLKNISRDSKINQNFYGTLDNFIFNTLFKTHFFTSLEMFRIFLYRIHLPKSLILKDIKWHLKSLLKTNIKQIKPDKKTSNALYILETFPNMQSQVDNFLEKLQKILESKEAKKIDNIIINPLNIISNPNIIKKQQFIDEFSKNLSVILNNADSKMISLDNDASFFYEILQCVESCVSDIGYPISVAISLPGYHLDSINMLKAVIETAKKLHAKRKARLIVRLKDIDINYEKEAFLSEFNHKPNQTFTNTSSVINNLLYLIQICEENSEYIEYYLACNNILILCGLKDTNIKLEVQKELNYPFYKIALKEKINLINVQYYTNDFTNVLAVFLKSRYIYLKNNLFSLINMQLNLKEWEKFCNAFAASINNLHKYEQKILNDSFKDSNIYKENLYNFDIFDYELQRDIQKEASFLDSIKTMDFVSLNKNKLEDVLYLNSKDMERLTLQGLSNIPITFSLNTQKEKQALELAHKKQDNILQNRIEIITIILNSLQTQKGALLSTLCEAYPNITESILQSQVYMLIDTFKYYACEYKILLNETKSVLIMNVGTIFIDASNLYIYEIAALIAANIMIGNISILSDCINSRILYFVLKDTFEFCPFMSIESNFLESKNAINNTSARIVLNKKDCINYESNNILAWDKGEAVVFISSFYDFYEAYLSVQEMKMMGNKHITIYTDEYIYKEAKKAFVPLNVIESSLLNLKDMINENISTLSIFTYNKAEINYILTHIKISISVNSGYTYKLISGSPRTLLAGFLPSFGCKHLLTKLLLTSPNSVIKNNSLYSDIIGTFSSILSVDELEFLYNLNHNYTQFLENLERKIRKDNIYELKHPYDMYIRVYKGDDLFHVCVIMLIAFLLDIKTRVSFSTNYFADSKRDNSILEILESNLKEKYIDIFSINMEDETQFLESISPYLLVRILQDESEFSTTNTYKEFRKKNIKAEYSLPVLNKTIELEKYLATQYIHIKPNFLLQTNVDS